jgi:UDP-N-acetylmuramoylalanine--D-glutamate ligase
MKVAVVGLGEEGFSALQSLLKHGHQVYGSDLNVNLDISMDDYEDVCEIDLGFHNWDKINDADAVVFSPSLWKTNIVNQLKDKNKIFSNVVNQHRKLFTIGVTGTNGKTTTSLMIRDILENAGYKVLVGGNAGGGFNGYTELMLEASLYNYDFLVVEVCDMTLDFSSYNFNFDLMVVTNLGYDHMNVHHSMAHFKETMAKFLEDKKAVLNKNDDILYTLGDIPEEIHFYNTYHGELHLIGKFNRENAAAACKVGELVSVPLKIIKESLSSFKVVSGRITEFNLDGTRVVIGKTDNLSALIPLFKEYQFDTAILGTPRKKEYWRFNIFKELADFKLRSVILFPGLDETTTMAEDELLKSGFNGRVKIIKNTAGVIKYLLSHYREFNSIFIGGNGQAKILEIKNYLEDNFDITP